MKTKSFLLFLCIFIFHEISAQVQTQLFTTENDKTGRITLSSSDIKDNQFSMKLSVEWLNDNLLPIADNKSVLLLKKTQIFIADSNLVKCPTLYLDNKAYFAINKELEVVFKISEFYKGGIVEFPLKFIYAESADKASNPEARKKMIFTKPLDMVFKYNIPYNLITDYTLPVVTIINPIYKKGFKPVIDSTNLTARVYASDFHGIKSVMINNMTAMVSHDTVYTLPLQLMGGGENEINILVTDNKGLTTKIDYTVVVANMIDTRVVKKEEEEEIKMVSDVDENIPTGLPQYENRYALIIGNEDYTKFQTGLETESNVDFARADAESFALYAENVLGIPKDKIVILKDAISTQMKREIDRLTKLMQYSNGTAEIFFFYAGHGFPDKSGNAYIMPVDVSGNDVENGIKLADLYKKFSTHPAKRVTVFLDACFSGGGRNQGLIAARSVKIKPKDEKTSGNLIVLSASSGSQESLPYKDKYHGIFTYYLLKKLQDSKGEVSYKDLTDYIINEVQINSVLINNRDQNPQVLVSPQIEGVWSNWTIR